MKEKVTQLETKLNQTVSEKIESLEISLAEELSLSNKVRNSEKYQELYTQPPPGRASQSKIDRINNIYWKFKKNVKSQEKYVDQAQGNLEKIKGSIRSIGEDLDGLISELENICSLANNNQEVGDEKYLAKKNEYCNKLLEQKYRKTAFYIYYPMACYLWSNGNSCDYFWLLLIQKKYFEKTKPS